MMKPWKLWKSGFDRWEKTTASYLDGVLQSPTVLAPSGIVLDLLMQSKVTTDRALAMWWSALGLPTRDLQERTLHRLNQLESRLLDLQEELDELRSQR